MFDKTPDSGNVSPAMRNIRVVVSLCTALGLVACETAEQSALLGAVTGAAIGGMGRGAKGRDVAKGALIGGAAGYVVGQYGENQKMKGRADAGGGPPPAPYGSGVPQAAPAPSYPYARPSAQHGYVFSPYTNQLVDTRRYAPGQPVRDPGSGQIFINP
jgi:hypothetical protein